MKMPSVKNKITRCKECMICSGISTCFCVFFGILGVGLFSTGTSYGILDRFTFAECKLENFSNERILHIRVISEDLNKTLLYNLDDNLEPPKQLFMQDQFVDCYYFLPTKDYAQDAMQDGIVYFDSKVLLRPYILTMIVTTIWFIFLIWLLVYFCIRKNPVIDPEITSRPLKKKRRKIRRNRITLPTPDMINLSSSSNKSSSEEDPENECIICLRNLFHNKKVITPPSKCCQKVVHEECFLKWLNVNNTCPNCNTEIIAN